MKCEEFTAREKTKSSEQVQQIRSTDNICENKTSTGNEQEYKRTPKNVVWKNIVMAMPAIQTFQFARECWNTGHGIVDTKKKDKNISKSVCYFLDSPFCIIFTLNKILKNCASQ